MEASSDTNHMKLEVDQPPNTVASRNVVVDGGADRVQSDDNDNGNNNSNSIKETRTRRPSRKVRTLLSSGLSLSNHSQRSLGSVDSTSNTTNSSSGSGNDMATTATGTEATASSSNMNVLATKYVPQHLLSINTRQVSRIIETRYGSPTANNNKNNNLSANGGTGINEGLAGDDTSLRVETERVFFGLIRDQFQEPYCQCTAPVPGGCHNAPAPTNVKEEAQHSKQLAMNRGSPRIPVESMSQGRDSYINVFRECLQIEYEETRRLYERYNQYEVNVTLVPVVRNNTVVARIDIAGIADARPALVPGDVVVLRPHEPIPFYELEHHNKTSSRPIQAFPPLSVRSHQQQDLYFTQQQQQQLPYPPPQNGFPPHHHSYPYFVQHPPPLPPPHPHVHPYQYAPMMAVAGGGKTSKKMMKKINKERTEYNRMMQESMEYLEIFARIISITRGNKARPDSIIITFIDNGTGQRCRLAKKLAQSLFTVRFVPSTTSHERSLTALSWLRTCSLMTPVGVKELLFPTKIPDLPPVGPFHENATDDGYDNDVEESEYEQLNLNQARFVQMMSNRTDNPTIGIPRPPLALTGPAGTGKSKTLLVAILQTLNRNNNKKSNIDKLNGFASSGEDSVNDTTPRVVKRRVLLCAPSHTACDVLTRRLVDLLSRQGTSRDKIKSMIFRLYDMERPVEMTPVELLPFTRQRGEAGDFCLPSTQELLEFSVIICTCQDAHLLYLAGLTNSSLRQRRQCLTTKLNRTIQAAGLSYSSKDDIIIGASQPHFTHLFIDEAAQATEPESLIPISCVMDFHPTAIKAEIALCGDPRQLSPGIFSPIAQECLQRSLLERLLRLPSTTYGGGREHLLGPPSSGQPMSMDELIEYSFQKQSVQDNLSVFLNLSYRGHPSFLLMPSKLFYFDKLRSATNCNSGLSLHGHSRDEKSNDWIYAVKSLELNTVSAYPESLAARVNEWPIHFRGVVGLDKSSVVETIFGSNSWCNEEEAIEILNIVDTLVKYGIGTQSIGVMALFRAQVVLIRKLLRDHGLGTVNVGTVENYQAVESDVVILSLTRSNEQFMRDDVTRQAGIFFQPKRMNVALTRAEHLLVVVGNPNVMVTDPAWKAWLVFARENGLWFGEKLALEERLPNAMI